MRETWEDQGTKDQVQGNLNQWRALGLGVDIWGAGFQRQRELHVEGVQVCHKGGGKCHGGGS